MMNVEAVEDLVTSGLELAGVSPAARTAAGTLMVPIVDWLEAKLAGGEESPEELLKAFLDSAEAQARLAEQLKFGTVG